MNGHLKITLRLLIEKYEIGPKSSPTQLYQETVRSLLTLLFGGLPLCFGRRPRQETFLVSAAYTSWCFVGRSQFSFGLPIPGSSVSEKYPMTSLAVFEMLFFFIVVFLTMSRLLGGLPLRFLVRMSETGVEPSNTIGDVLLSVVEAARQERSWKTSLSASSARNSLPSGDEKVKCWLNPGVDPPIRYPSLTN